MTFYKANHSAFTYSDHCGMAFVPGMNPAAPPLMENNTARFTRPFAGEWGNARCAPGARIRFNCNAASFDIYARCSAQGQGPTLTSAAVMVGGVFNRWIETPGASVLTKTTVNAGAYSAGRLIEIILPSGDPFDFVGVDCPAPSTVLASPPRPSQRALFIGDSITQGFGTSSVLQSWPHKLCAAKGWQQHNMGYAMMGMDPNYSNAAGGVGVAMGVQRVIVALGVNSFQTQVPLADFNGQAFWTLGGPRSQMPAPVKYYIITPTWMENENAPALKLEEYRVIIRNTATFLNYYGSDVTLIEGPSLVPASPEYYQDGLHLNDAGATAMAASLQALVS